MKKPLSKLLVILVLATCLTSLSAKDELPYTEGPVIDVGYIKTKPGMFDEYMKWLATDWKKFNEELKAAGLILDARVYAATPRNPGDPDIILTVVYKNMAALDNLDERSSAVLEKVAGSRKKANEDSINRGSMRDVLGSQLIRELVLR